jgi:hypothetical protein
MRIATIQVRPLLLLVCASGAVVIGCQAASTGVRPAPTTPIASAGDQSSGAIGPLLITVKRSESMWPSAAMEGSLSIDAKGCMIFEGRLVVWPADARWVPNQSAVEVPGISRLAHVGQVVLGGGEVDELDPASLSAAGRVNLDICSGLGRGYAFLSP